MVKLVALYRKPDDPAAFDNHYFNVHLPLSAKMPGLRKVEVSRFTGAPGGEAPYYLIAELYFDSQDALQSALASPEGKAAGKDLMSIAKGIVAMSFAEVAEV